MITSAMRAILIDELDFDSQEVDEMRPEVAARLIETRTKRPFGDRPMPDAWKRGGPAPGGSRPSGNALVRLFFVAVLGLGVAVATGKLTLGTLLGGAEFGRQPIKKLSSEMKPKSKKKKKKLTTSIKGKAAARTQAKTRS